MSKKMELIIGQYELHTRLYHNVLADLSDNSANRLNDRVNHLSWLAGHLVSTRYMLANVLGAGLEEPHPQLFENGKGIEPDSTYPSTDESLGDWEKISPVLLEKLKAVPDDALEGDGPFPIPMGKKMGEFIAFIIHHESYHIGQIGILRKYFGQEAMKYS